MTNSKEIPYSYNKKQKQTKMLRGGDISEKHRGQLEELSMAHTGTV